MCLLCSCTHTGQACQKPVVSSEIWAKMEVEVAARVSAQDKPFLHGRIFCLRRCVCYVGEHTPHKPLKTLLCLQDLGQDGSGSCP